MTLVVLMTVPSWGLVVLDFEGIPALHHYYNGIYGGGNVNLGGYYPGVSFGADATILDNGLYPGIHNSAGFPPHSGTGVLFSYTDPLIRVDFSSPVNHVEVWYTSYSTFYFEAYNSLDALVGGIASAANTDGFSGLNYYLSITSAFFDIAYVKMHDTGNFYTIDDFGYNTAIPEPATMLLLGSGLLGMGGIGAFRFRRKK